MAEGVDYGRALRGNLDHQVTVTPVHLVKGLELDACIVVEPTDILERRAPGRPGAVRRADPGHQAAVDPPHPPAAGRPRLRRLILTGRGLLRSGRSLRSLLQLRNPDRPLILMFGVRDVRNGCALVGRRVELFCVRDVTIVDRPLDRGP